jgi:VIT1/CCC1 family predicted Fe2+/Mn2+ transporter
MVKKGESINNEPSPVINGATTYTSFILVGFVPLLAYTVDYVFGPGLNNLFLIATALTALAFIGIGWLKSKVAQSHVPRAVAETLVLGAIAASLAYLLGDLLESIIT